MNLLHRLRSVKHIVFVTLLLGIVALFVNRYFRAEKAEVIFNSNPQYTNILDEMMSVEVISRPPVPSSSGELLVNIRNGRHGRGISLIDLKTLGKRSLDFSNDIRRVGGFSPNGRYLEFEQRPSQFRRVLKETQDRPLEEDRDEAWVTLLDLKNFATMRVTTNREVNERSFIWLDYSSYAFCSDSDDPEHQGIYVGSLTAKTTRKVGPLLGDIVRMTESKVAFIKNNNIHSFEMSSGIPGAAVNDLSDFPEGSYDLLRWLRYSPETQHFLFCARPTNSIWRYLFEYDPQTRTTKQLTDQDTYNGQWLTSGGFAYVGNSNNNFYLAIRPREADKRTNLFIRGSVANYTVSSHGEKLYATAAQDIEPQALWEYNIDKQRLRQVTRGILHPLKASTLITPKEFRAKSFDGLEVPYFIFPPRQRETDKKDRGRQSPVVIYIPPRTFQVQRVFDPRAEILANLGFYFVGVNYRGCDGYGSLYASKADAVDGAKDVLAVYREVMRNPLVDKENVFLMTSSYGSTITFEVLILAPDLWRAAAFMHPQAPSIERLPKNLPPLYLRTWKSDPHLHNLIKLKEWADSNGLEMILQGNTADEHIDYSTLNARERQDHIARFYIEHLIENW